MPAGIVWSRRSSASSGISCDRDRAAPAKPAVVQPASQSLHENLLPMVMPLRTRESRASICQGLHLPRRVCRPRFACGRWGSPDGYIQYFVTSSPVRFVALALAPGCLNAASKGSDMPTTSQRCVPAKTPPVISFELKTSTRRQNSRFEITITARCSSQCSLSTPRSSSPISLLLEGEGSRSCQ